MPAAITRRTFLSTVIGAAVSMASSIASAQEKTVVIHGTAAPRVELIHPGVQRYLREIGMLR